MGKKESLINSKKILLFFIKNSSSSIDMQMDAELMKKLVKGYKEDADARRGN